MVEISKPATEKYLSIILGCLLGLMRPTAIGEVYSFQLAILATIILGLFFIIQRGRVGIIGSKYLLIQLFLVILLGVYLVCHGFLMAYTSADIVLKMFLLTIVPVMAIVVIVQNTNAVKYFFDGFAIIILVSCVSITISFLLLVAGVGYEQLHVFDFPYTYEGRGYVIFPMSFTFNSVNLGFGYIPRLSGLYREPGVVPAFACWGATYSYLRRWPNWITILFLAGSLFSLSTLGVVSLYTGALILADRIGIRLRTSLLILALIILTIWPVLYSLEGIGLQTKAESGSGSYEERYEQFYAFFDIDNFLFGDGPNWSIYSTSSINILAASRTYGAVFFALVIAIISFSTLHRFMFVAAFLPFIFVVLTAQPIVFEASVLVIWFSWIRFRWQAI